MYNATTTPPPQSSKVRCSGRWDQQHDGVVLMVESICGQRFAYAREVEEDRQRSSQTRVKEATGNNSESRRLIQNQVTARPNLTPFIARSWLRVRAKSVKPSPCTSYVCLASYASSCRSRRSVEPTPGRGRMSALLPSALLAASAIAVDGLAPGLCARGLARPKACGPADLVIGRPSRPGE
jgi:hypothetical protein